MKRDRAGRAPAAHPGSAQQRSRTRLTVVRDYVSTVLLPAQRQSHDLCRSLKRFVKAAA
jgi:hypothetical protein